MGASFLRIGERLVPKHSFFLELGNCLQNDFLRPVNAEAFDGELKGVFLLAEEDFWLEFFRPDALTACRATRGVFYISSLSDVLDIENTHRAKRLELLCVGSFDLLLQLNHWHELVVSGADGRPLGMCLTDAFLADDFDLNLLARS